MTAETIEQFAARVCQTWPFKIEQAIIAELPAFLAALPPRVVEVNADDLNAAMRLCEGWVRTEMVDAVNARLRARAPTDGFPMDYDTGYQRGLTRGEEIGRALAPRPVMDVEITDRDVLRIVAQYSAGASAHRVADDFTAELRIRHVTDTGSAMSGEDLYHAIARHDDHQAWLAWDSHTQQARDFWGRVAASLSLSRNTSQWITVPTTQTPGELVAPETGWYLVKWATPADWSLSPTWKTGGVEFHAGVAAVRLWNTKDGSTGPLIERSTTPTRAWTAESVPAGNVVTYGDDEGLSIYFDWMTREMVAKAANKQNATHLYILPEPPR